MLEKIKGVRKLSALLLCVIAALIGAIYMQEYEYIGFLSLLTAGLTIFAVANTKENNAKS